MLIRKAFLSACLVVLVACTGKPHKAVPADVTPTVIYLVRHAEKASSSPDPELTETGKARADTLAAIVSSLKPMRVHSTDYIRTRQTAAPSALALDTKVEIYDASNLAIVASWLKQAGGRHLVVGHSDTTPALVTALGGDPLDPIDDKTEFDRLYIVEIDGDGDVTSKLERYGD